MPYTLEKDRIRYRDVLDQLPPIENVGNLTFILTTILQRAWVNSAQRYQVIAELFGALEVAKADFWEHVAKPYEAKKEWDNGGIW